MNRVDVLVTGGTGKVGSQTLRALLSKKELNIRALVRHLADARWIVESGGELIEGDLDNARVLSRALSGVSTVALISPPSERAAEQCARVIALSKQQGVRKIVRLSTIKASETGPTEETRQHGVTERLIRESGMNFVFLRPNYLMQNLLGSLGPIIAQGKLYAGLGDARIALIDARDVGDAMASAILTDAFDGSAFELSGPKSITLSTAAAVIGSALGRKVKYVAVAPEVAGDMLRWSGEDDWAAQLVVSYSRAYAKGFGDFVTDSVKILNQNAPRDITSFAWEVFVPAANSFSDKRMELRQDA
jgi:uncharacterized protein YbjT (DUF2867 family)